MYYIKNVFLMLFIFFKSTFYMQLIWSPNQLLHFNPFFGIITTNKIITRKKNTMNFELKKIKNYDGVTIRYYGRRWTV